MSTTENPVTPEEKVAEVEVTQPATEAQQQEITKKIRLGCDIRELSSIVDTWDALLASGCEEQYYANYIRELDTAILPLISTTKDPAALQAMRELLSKDPVRFEKHIGRVDDKLKSIELGQRSYKGEVLDSPDAVAQAKEEEARLEAVMRGVDRNRLDSIDAAIAQVNTSPSPIKKTYLDTLQTLRLEIVQKGCTYRGVVYESPAQAEHAKQVFAWAQGIYNSVNVADEASVQAALAHLTGANHKATDEFIELLKNALEEIDARKRTVDGIVFDTMEEADTARQDLPVISAVMSGLNPSDEPSLLDAKARLSECKTKVRDKYLSYVEQQLTAYDLKIRTFRDKVCETREEAILLRQEEARVREILAPMNPADEGSMLQARAALEILTTYLKDEPLTTVNRLLNEYDVRIRTFNGVLYETREEAVTVAQEFQIAAAIMQNVSPDNEASILQAQQAMQALTTTIKDARLQELQQIWDAFDLKMRSYGALVFDTREEAQLARDTYQVFMNQFNAMDLDQSANLVILDQYIATSLQEKMRPYATQLVNNVRTVHSRIAYIYHTDSVLDINVHKKESADLYKYIEETLPLMTQYRMRTDNMENLKKKHYASLNMGKKILSFFKK